ncbi:hypothetical protein [Halomarina litorea]|uniref:hypothetical protein n=1 Tax=Halomarina litorea TaxID=2961595 RepID=UPI0020C3AAAB|nr:hypothetical protein [Halomarina sp. BCD28]
MNSESIRSEAAFHEALRALVLEAAENGVQVEGGWPVSNDGGPDWDVEIVGLVDRGGD